jgi:sensor domain CHASE-containing protein/nitrogen-specific signal transduction histidine kinase
MICLLIAIYGISSNLFLRDFIKLERESVVNSVKGILSILNDDISALSSAVGDWAAWDDTYSFIKDANPLYVKKNLPDETYLELKLNLILFVNSSGEIIYGRGFDLLQKKGMPLQTGLKEYIAPFLKHSSVDSSIQGIVLLPEGHMLIASRPILTSERKGPIRGSMIFGRYLNDEEINRWSEITKLSVKMYPMDSFEIFSDLKDSGFNQESNSIFVKPVDSKIISGYVVVKDVYDKPAMLLRIDVPRTIYQQGKLTLNRFVLLLGASGVIFGVVILFLVEKSVLARMMRLGSEVRDITEKGRHSLRVGVEGRDELANIGKDINEMLKSLERSHSLINAVIEDLPEGVVLLNSEYRVVLANKVGLQHLKKLSNAGMGDVLSYLGGSSLIEMASNFSHPSRIVRQNINVGNFFFDVTGKYIGKGKDIGIVLVTMDVTQEKTELMERIKSRENLSAVGQLAAGIAHDFNNILTSVIGYAGLLYADSTLPDKIRHQLKIILNNAERAAELVLQILDFSRKSFSEFEVLDLSLYLEDFIKFIKRTIPENININFECETGEYRIKTDRTKLQQVLTNLSLNAKDAMPAGGELVFALSRISVNKEGKMLIYDSDILLLLFIYLKLRKRQKWYQSA